MLRCRTLAEKQTFSMILRSIQNNSSLPFLSLRLFLECSLERLAEIFENCRTERKFRISPYFVRRNPLVNYFQKWQSNFQIIFHFGEIFHLFWFAKLQFSPSWIALVLRAIAWAINSPCGLVSVRLGTGVVRASWLLWGLGMMIRRVRFRTGSQRAPNLRTILERRPAETSGIFSFINLFMGHMQDVGAPCAYGFQICSFYSFLIYKFAAFTLFWFAYFQFSCFSVFVNLHFPFSMNWVIT